MSMIYSEDSSKRVAPVKKVFKSRILRATENQKSRSKLLTRTITSKVKNINKEMRGKQLWNEHANPHLIMESWHPQANQTTHNHWWTHDLVTSQSRDCCLSDDAILLRGYQRPRPPLRVGVSGEVNWSWVWTWGAPQLGKRLHWTDAAVSFLETRWLCIPNKISALWKTNYFYGIFQKKKL